MRALVFNSGLGSRLGRLTADRPKCLVRLGSGETILHRQLRVLSSVGVREFVVTTGPYPDLVEAECRPFEASGCRFSFVRNDSYAETNYIYSMWLARDLVAGGDLLVLHGDLVFDAGYVAGLLALPEGSYGSVDPALPVPEKDFSVEVEDGLVRRVGVGIEGENLMAFQAMYRLTAEAVDVWLGSVAEFVARGETGVYAEDAANEVFGEMHVLAHSYAEHVLEEVDTPEDLARVSAMVRARDFADQPAWLLAPTGTELVSGSPAGRAGRPPRPGRVVGDRGLSRPLVVADPFLSRCGLEALLGPGDWPTFSGYSPNPTYGQVLDAVRAYREGGCDSVVSVGGGSAMDVAKCVKLWAGMPGDGSGRDGGNPRYCDVEPPFSDVAHVAVPTTAGTGSESTHFAVVYVDGEKRSVAADCLQPDTALLVPGLLEGLPDYQRRSTMLDALCQAIESHWSVASSPESRAYSSRAIPMVMGCWEAYLAGDSGAAAAMHVAANLAGRAINLTTTTLAHAMSYKLTSLYGLAHGHAVALCMPFAWRMLLERGDEKTRDLLREVDTLVTGDGGAALGSGLAEFEWLVSRLDLPAFAGATEADLNLLVRSVNPQRMGNYPVELTVNEFRKAYGTILDVL